MFKRSLVPLALAAAATAATAAPHLVISVTGSPEVVYSYTNDHCSSQDVPDNPARAFKNANGDNVLVFGNSHGYYYTTTPTLGAPINHDCNSSVLSSAGATRNSNPGSYYNALWIIAPWTQNGNDVYALVHNEYHPAHGSGDNGLGYWNMISAVSHDGGHTFQLNTYPNGQPIPTIASPFQYDATTGGLQGFTAETNIIETQGYEYLLVGGRIPSYTLNGMCLYRSNNMADPTSWRAWDGTGFNIQTVNPYQHTVQNAQSLICKPVLPIGAFHYNWIYDNSVKEYISIGRMPNRWNNNLPKGQMILAYVYSKDMFHWSKPYLLSDLPENMTAVTSLEGNGTTQYYGILDPSSPGMNFDQAGPHPYLYYTYFKGSPGSNWNRDMVRQQLTVEWSNS